MLILACGRRRQEDVEVRGQPKTHSRTQSKIKHGCPHAPAIFRVYTHGERSAQVMTGPQLLFCFYLLREDLSKFVKVLNFSNRLMWNN